MLLFVCPSGCEDLLAAELLAFGADEGRLRRGAGVVTLGAPHAPEATGAATAAAAPAADAAVLWTPEPQDVAVGLRACLHSRVASRALVVLSQFACDGPDALYAGVRRLPWHDVFAPSATLAIDCPRGEGALQHTQYAAQVCKDGVVDAFRAHTGERPSVDLRQPDVRLQLLLRRGVATVAYDLAGEALHRRGYRLEGGAAPLKENLAAAILLRAGWPAAAAAPGAAAAAATTTDAAPNAVGARLVDPMCGSGTLLIEGAWMAAGMPPSALRQRYALTHWRGLDAALWQSLRAEADAMAEAARQRLGQVSCLGFDADAAQVQHAIANVARAGLTGHVALRRRAVADVTLDAPEAPATWVCNPPYGERLAPGDAALMGLYGELGAALRRHPGASGHVLVAERALGYALNLRAHRHHALRNGQLSCTLLHFAPQAVAQAHAARRGPPQGQAAASATGQAVASATGEAADPAIAMLENRLAKNQRRLRGYLQQNAIRAYRIYDADLPEYNAAIDVYEGEDGVRRLHVQEYAAPASIPEAVADKRWRALVQAVPKALQARPQDVHLKVRRRQQPEGQYGPQGRAANQDAAARRSRAHEPEFFQVVEDGLRYWISLDAYIDTGLYLDHRRLRAKLRQMAAGAEVLNLFCYTGSVSVACAAGGARSTTSVDLSKTYLRWAADNLEANGYHAPRHALAHGEVEDWLAAARRERRTFDLIFCGPPTFTNSRRARQDFDVLRDHERLIDAAMAVLRPGGTLVFSSHARRLKLQPALATRYRVDELTQQTLPQDFARSRPHRTWQLSHPGGVAAAQL